MSKRHSERFSKGQDILDLIKSLSSEQAKSLSPEWARLLHALVESLPLSLKMPPELAENVKNSSVFKDGKLLGRTKDDLGWHGWHDYEVADLNRLCGDVALRLWAAFHADQLKEEVLAPFFALFLEAFGLLETMAQKAEVKPKLKKKGKIELSDIREALEFLIEGIKSKLPIKKLEHHDAYEIAKLFRRHVPGAPASVIADRVSELLTEFEIEDQPSPRTTRDWLK